MASPDTSTDQGKQAQQERSAGGFARLGPLGARLRTALAPLASTLRRPRWIRAGIAVLAFVALSVVLIFVITSGGPSGSHPASSGGSAQGEPSGRVGSRLVGGDHRALPPGATGSTVGGTAKVVKGAGAVPLPRSKDRRVVAWYRGRGGALLAAISSAYGSVTQSGGIRQYATMRYNCTLLAARVAAARSGPPIPDAAMQKLYRKALIELAKAAADCKTAISQQPDGDESIETHENPQLLRQTNTELAAGASDLFKATAEIQVASLRRH
jgi:hypothetical protein